MTTRCELSILIPAYQEEENLRLLLPRLHRTIRALDLTYEIIVIDTQQPLDNTRAVCQDETVTYLMRQHSNSFGDAVRSGIAAAQGEFILFMDADGSHTPEYIPRLCEHRREYDVVIASRYIDGGHTENIKILVLMSHVVNLCYRLVLGLRCKDVSNSFKVYRANLVKEVPLRCHNFDVVEELLYKICRRHPDVRILEVPFSFKKRMFGETKRNLIMFMFSYLYTLLRLRFGK
jgi:dolichol-phosphate mannosyltransferase